MTASTPPHDPRDPDHPRTPDSPTDIRRPSWIYVLRRTVREFITDECTLLGAALTYYAVLSIFPALVALVSILSLTGQDEEGTNKIISMLEDVVPPDAMAQIEPIIQQLTQAPAPGVGLVIGLLVSLWTASNYVSGFAKAMNRIYQIPEGRPIWKFRPWTYLLTLVILVLVAVAALLLVVGGPVASALGSAVGLGSAAVTAWNIARWPLLVVVVIVIVALLYYGSPNIKQPKFRWISIGAVLAILMAALATAGFGFYISSFGSYDQTYGALGGVIVFLLWLWVMNLALLAGAEFDAELERGRQLQAGIAAEERIQLPPRDTTSAVRKARRHRDDVERGRALRLSRGHTQDPDAPARPSAPTVRGRHAGDERRHAGDDGDDSRPVQSPPRP